MPCLPRRHFSVRDAPTRRCGIWVVVMDLLKAEIERKRKAKADEFGGHKYVKRSHITAVRAAKLREEEEAERGAKGGAGFHGGDAAGGDTKAEEAARLKQLQAEADDKGNAAKARATLEPPWRASTTARVLCRSPTRRARELGRIRPLRFPCPRVFFFLLVRQPFTAFEAEPPPPPLSPD